MGVLDKVRARASAALERVPGKAGEKLRAANELLGRPLADAGELADRRAFEAQTGGRVDAKAAAAANAASTRDAAPVIVYHMDKTRRDAQRLVEILEDAKIPHRVSNIQEDPAAQMAVKRDSKGFRMPVVFIAGEPVGGRAELTNLAGSGELQKKVFG
jgi:glutaredoxin-related protein